MANQTTRNNQTDDRKARGGPNKDQKNQQGAPVPKVNAKDNGKLDASTETNDGDEKKTGGSLGLNQIVLIGNLGQAPEVRYTQSGTAVANLSVAVNGRKKQGEEWVPHVEWFRCTVWGKDAENCGQYLEKGRRVSVIGEGQHKVYKDKDGADQRSFEVHVHRILFL